MLEIRTLRPEEIPSLKDFAPPDWNTDLSAVFSTHYGQPYFYPIVAELDGKVAGCANGLLHGKAGWLGNIIVLPENRRMGIGGALTQALVEYFRGKDVDHQVLVATRLGEPVYRKLGFETVSNYIFLKYEGPAFTDVSSSMRSMEPGDARSIFDLDRSVTGELRQQFLGRFMTGAWVHLSASGSVDGYYLPKLGTGLVIAANDTAGLALMRHKLGQGGHRFIVPEGNQAAVDLLGSNGFVETGRAPRMCLGGDLPWQPEHVYCRGAGYSG